MTAAGIKFLLENTDITEFFMDVKHGKAKLTIHFTKDDQKIEILNPAGIFEQRFKY